MAQSQRVFAVSSRKLAEQYNAIIAASMSMFNLIPVAIFYLPPMGEWKLFLLFLLPSLIIARLPDKFFDRIQLSKNLLVYKKLGVHGFKAYATNGDLINKSVRERFPKHSNIESRTDIEQKIKQTYAVEKAHWGIFLFCLLTSILAFYTHHFGKGALFTVGNIVFNFYPSLLQQYNRIRYKRVAAILKLDNENASNNAL